METNCETNSGFPHRLTQEERTRGGRAITPRKRKALAFNSLKHGKYAKSEFIMKLMTCDTCAGKDACPKFTKSSPCKILIETSKRILNMGLRKDIIDVWHNLVVKLMEFSEDIARLEIEKSRIEQDLKKLYDERDRISFMNSDGTPMDEQKKLELKMKYNTAIFSIRNQMSRLVNDILDRHKEMFYMICQFKKTVYGDDVNIHEDKANEESDIRKQLKALDDIKN